MYFRALIVLAINQHFRKQAYFGVIKGTPSINKLVVLYFFGESTFYESTFLGTNFRFKLKQNVFLGYLSYIMQLIFIY